MLHVVLVCTGANLEEDLFNLFAHDEYRLVPHYRDLSPNDELELRDQGFNRVTDTCIPESCFRAIEGRLIERWREAEQRGERRFATEYFAEILGEPDVQSKMQVAPENSWVLAALEKQIPVFTPGFEDSTMGNIFAARVIDGTLGTHDIIRSGTEQMQRLVDWYLETTQSSSVGFFQIGGGIAGDFAICAVPLILQDLEKDAPLWSYFAQISDSTTSYGSYSGAVPNEKITWYKLDRDAPKFMINSDASICAPLIFAYILGL